LTNFSAEAEGITSESIIARLLKETPVNEPKGLKDAGSPKVFGS
jgi:hypothetical protein